MTVTREAAKNPENDDYQLQQRSMSSELKHQSHWNEQLVIQTA
jgi:hypothetical protein